MDSDKQAVESHGLEVGKSSYQRPLEPDQTQDTHHPRVHNQRKGRIPWGLSLVPFTFLVALLTIIIVGAVVGGSVAGVYGNKYANFLDRT
jgi:hypothetical protein